MEGLNLINKKYLVLTNELRNYPRGSILTEHNSGYHLFRPDRIAPIPSESFLPKSLVESDVTDYFDELTEEKAWIIDAYSSIVLRSSKKDGKNTGYPELFVMENEWTFLTHQAWMRRPKPFADVVSDLITTIKDDNLEMEIKFIDA